jgi:predicted secreted protein
MTAVPEFEFRTSTKCSYDNNDPRCLEVATNRSGTVAVRNSTTGKTVEFTTAEWTDFLAGAKVGEFDVKP